MLAGAFFTIDVAARMIAKPCDEAQADLLTQCDILASEVVLCETPMIDAVEG
jgi:hypothetical protein